MTIAILATGDEIIHGDTLNTNGFDIAHALSAESMQLGMQLACSDKESDIVDGLRFLSRHHQTIIIMGGLGPTSDDRTRFALARFLNTPLIEHDVAIKHIQTRLSRAGLELNAGNRQQAYFPEKAKLLANPHGTALGCCYQHQDQLFFLLPGPPIECLNMFHTDVLPYLRQQLPPSQKQLIKWRLFGVSEGMIAEKLDQALQHLPCETGYRLERPYLEFKIICHQDDISTVKQIIDPMVKPYIIASPEQRASERLQSVIEQLQQSIVITDEATGGLLQTLIQRPSNFQWLHFQSTSHADWYFHIQGLQEYWQQESEKKTSQISLSYRGKNKENNETHTLPYYSPWVVNAAAEWLAFQIVNILVS